MLGIIIGVVTIVSMGILGNSLVLAISDSLSSVGDSIIVTPHSGGVWVWRRRRPGIITDRQVDEIRRAVAPDITIPVYSGSSRMTIGGEDAVGVIYGLDPTISLSSLNSRKELFSGVRRLPWSAPVLRNRTI